MDQRNDLLTSHRIKEQWSGAWRAIALRWEEEALQQGRIESRAELAAHCEIDPSRFSGLMNGGRRWTSEIFAQLAAALGVSAELAAVELAAEIDGDLKRP